MESGKWGIGADNNYLWLDGIIQSREGYNMSRYQPCNIDCFGSRELKGSLKYWVYIGVGQSFCLEDNISKNITMLMKSSLK